MTPYSDIGPGSYDFYWNGEKIASEIHLPQGGVHTFVISKDKDTEPKVFDFLLTKENSVHMLWLIPQFFIITVGEILFSITALEFSYSQVIFIYNRSLFFVPKFPIGLKIFLKNISCISSIVGMINQKSDHL